MLGTSAVRWIRAAATKMRSLSRWWLFAYLRANKAFWCSRRVASAATSVSAVHGAGGRVRAVRESKSVNHTDALDSRLRCLVCHEMAKQFGPEITGPRIWRVVFRHTRAHTSAASHTATDGCKEAARACFARNSASEPRCALLPRQRPKPNTSALNELLKDIIIP